LGAGGQVPDPQRVDLGPGAVRGPGEQAAVGARLADADIHEAGLLSEDVLVQQELLASFSGL